MTVMRPTTKDLAKAAGVSLATVDRVLNERPGVRKATVRAVNEAIGKIGFIRNISAANLARGRVYRMRFLLPCRGGAFMGAVQSKIEEARSAFATDAVDVSHAAVLEPDPHQIVAHLSSLSSDGLDGVAIMAAESPQVRDAISRLIERGVHVVQFLSGQPGLGQFDFVGIDNHAAGATAGRLLGRFTGVTPGKILVVADSTHALHIAERRLGFDAVIAADFPHLRALPTVETHATPDRTVQVIQSALAAHPDIVATYIAESEAMPALEVLRQHGVPDRQVIIAHERTDYTVRMLKDGVLDAVIAQNPGHLVRSAVRLLKARCDQRVPLASQEEIRIEILIRENLSQN